jgi:hypothetical protein
MLQSETAKQQKLKKTNKKDLVRLTPEQIQIGNV